MSLPLIPEDILEPDDPIDLDAIIDDMLVGEDSHLRLVPATPGVSIWKDDPDEPPWRVLSVRAAEWAMGKVAAATRRRAEKQALAEEYHRQIDDWLRRDTARDNATILFLSSQLQEFAIGRRREDDRETTLRLPSGEVPTTKSKPKAKLVDEAAAVGWARERFGSLLVKTTYSVSITDLRKVVTVAGDSVICDGEVVPGLEVDPETITAKAKPA